jgi:hypothetical protein
MYFDNFPSILYPVTSDQIQQAKDLLVRVGFSETTKEQAATFSDYFVEEGQTPERIAYEVYGDPQYYWVVLLINSIIDPQYSFPLRSRSLEDYINKKYPTNTFFLTPVGEEGSYYSLTNTDKVNFREGDTVTSYLGYLQYGDVGAFKKLGTIRKVLPNLSAIQMWYYEGIFREGDTLVRGYDGEIKATIKRIVSSKEALHHFEYGGKVLNPLATPPDDRNNQVPLGMTGAGFPDPVQYSQTLLYNYINDNDDPYAEYINVGQYVVSNRDYEFAQNEKKRRIKLLRPELLENATRELRNILRS